MTYNIALIGDTHFGIKNNSDIFLETMNKFFFETLPKICKEKDIKEIRLLGDLFDNRNSINVKILCNVYNIFKWWSENFAHIEIKLLVGNHDIYYHNRLDINSVKFLQEFHNVKIISKITEEDINGKKIITVPWIVKNSELETEFQKICENTTNYDLCLGHFEINGFEMMRGFEMTEGFVHSKFRNFKRVCSGHYHLKNINDRISYVGSPYQLNWGDKNDIKGISILDLETNNMEFIEETNAPKHIEIFLSDILEDQKIWKSVEKSIEGNFINLIINRKVKQDSVSRLVNRIQTLNPKILSTELKVESIIQEDVLLSSQDDFNIFKDPLSAIKQYIEQAIDDTIDKSTLTTYMEDVFRKVIK